MHLWVWLVFIPAHWMYLWVGLRVGTIVSLNGLWKVNVANVYEVSVYVRLMFAHHKMCETLLAFVCLFIKQLFFYRNVMSISHIYLYSVWKAF